MKKLLFFSAGLWRRAGWWEPSVSGKVSPQESLPFKKNKQTLRLRFSPFRYIHEAILRGESVLLDHSATVKCCILTLQCVTLSLEVKPAHSLLWAQTGRQRTENWLTCGVTSGDIGDFSLKRNGQNKKKKPKNIIHAFTILAKKTNSLQKKWALGRRIKVVFDSRGLLAVRKAQYHQLSAARTGHRRLNWGWGFDVLTGQNAETERQQEGKSDDECWSLILAFETGPHRIFWLNPPLSQTDHSGYFYKHTSICGMHRNSSLKYIINMKNSVILD